MTLTSLAHRFLAGSRRGSVVSRDPGGSTRSGELVQLLPDEAAIGRLRQFAINHRLRQVDGLVGEHRSRRRGAAPEFSDYSPYTPGDDVRRIDWNAYARFDTLYVRESEVTTELDVHFLMDTSASMDWSGAPERQRKIDLARKIVTTLSWIALARSDRVTVSGTSVAASGRIGPLQGRGNVAQIAGRLLEINPAGSDSVLDAMQRYARQRGRSGFLFVLTDLVGATQDDLERALSVLANERWQVVVLLMEDPLEIDPGQLSTSQDVFELEDPESHTRQRVNLHPDTVRQYRQRRAMWMEGLVSSARQRSVPLIRISTEARVDPEVLLALERAQVIVS